MFTKILLATDFSEASVAAREAALALARRCMGRIDAVHVISSVEEIYDASRFLVPDEQRQLPARKELKQFFSTTEHPNSSHHVLVGGFVVEEILKHARNERHDLIVVGSHGRTAAERVFLGSVAQRIIRESEIPVIVVKRLKHSTKKYQGFDRVLCPTDFSDASMKAIDFGVKFANFLKADFDLIHVVDFPALQEVNKNYSVRIPEGCELNCDPTLKLMVEKKELVGKRTVATLSGEPDHEILKYIRESKADFVVMATHRKTAMERVFIGSVTASIVARSGVPVITIAPIE